MNETKAQRRYSEASRQGFLMRMERAVDPDRPKLLQPNIKAPSDFQFAHGVLSGYVTGLKSETKQD